MFKGDDNTFGLLVDKLVSVAAVKHSFRFDDAGVKRDPIAREIHASTKSRNAEVWQGARVSLAGFATNLATLVETVFTTTRERAKAKESPSTSSGKNQSGVLHLWRQSTTLLDIAQPARVARQVERAKARATRKAMARRVCNHLTWKLGVRNSGKKQTPCGNQTQKLANQQTMRSRKCLEHLTSILYSRTQRGHYNSSA